MVSPVSHPAFICAVCVVSLLTGCRQDVLGAPEVPEAVREQDPGPASEEAPETAPSAAPDRVEIDLTEFGMSARLQADARVEAEGTPDGIMLRSDDGFELIVGRGSLDMTAEREELVRAYGARFKRFLTDSPEVVAWEVSGAAESRYFFFASFERETLSHHCRTGPDGAESPQLVETMIDICRSVTPSSP